MRSWPPSLRSLAGRMIGDWNTAELPEPISQTDQSWITSRLAQLEAWRSAGSERDALVPILMALFAIYPAAAIGEEIAAVKVRGYLSVLSDRPIWAVRAAAEQWMRGEVGGEEAQRFPPSAARLRSLATDQMRGVFEEIAALQKLRRAKVVRPIDPADMAARRAQVAKLLGGEAA